MITSLQNPEISFKYFNNKWRIIMEKYVLIHVPHSSLYIPDDYRKTSLLTEYELDYENLFMCDYKVDQLLDDVGNAIIFPYSRLYCDVERFMDDSEVMNKYGMGVIYTKTSDGKEMFRPSISHKMEVINVYNKHHQLLNDKVTAILEEYKRCVIIDLHSYQSDLVLKLFNYDDVPDICIGVEDEFSSNFLVNHFTDYFVSSGYSVMINYPYKGSLIPNKYYGKSDTGIVSIMLEINKRVYLSDFDKFKRVLNGALDFKLE